MSSVQIRFLFHYLFCSCLSTDKVIVRVLGYGVMWQQLMTTLGLRIYHPGFVIQSWPGEYKEFLSAANIKPVETPTAPHLFRKSPASGLPQKHTHMRTHTQSCWKELCCGPCAEQTVAFHHCLMGSWKGHRYLLHLACLCLSVHIGSQEVRSVRLCIYCGI